LLVIETNRLPSSQWRKVKAFTGFERAARLKLDRLDAAIALADLAALPGDRFEALKGNEKDRTASALTIYCDLFNVGQGGTRPLGCRDS